MNTVPDAISVRQLDVLFGPARQQGNALRLLDAGQSREQILEQTGVVLGVADASLDVPAGSISVLMGLSGSGKSSLLRCVNGLNKVTRGVLEVTTREGVVNVATCKGAELRRLRRHNLAMVFQQFALLPWASVRENIGFGLSVRGESDTTIRQSVDRQLELVGLQAWADKPIHTLSGGMQQRVGLARAFATDADILLMDEPFSALDPLIREHLQDELLELQSRLKKTILFVSHDLDEALKIGNQISIMDGGRIVQTGTANDIVFNPANDYVSRFVANINPLSVLSAVFVMQALDMPGDSLEHEATAMRFFRNADGSLAARHQGSDCYLHVVTGHVGAHSATPSSQGGTSTADAPVASLLPDSAATAASREADTTVYCVTPDTPVNTLLKLATRSLRPLLVLDDNRQLCGLIQDSDLMRALQRD